MSSLIAEYRQLEKRLNDLKTNKLLQHELEFQSRLSDLLKTYDMSPAKAIDIIRESYPITASKPKQQSLKTYKNPHTGETAEVATLLAKPVVEWVKEHGKEEVKKWVQMAA